MRIRYYEPLESADLKAIDALFKANINAANTGILQAAENATANTGVKAVDINHLKTKAEDFMSRKEKRKYDHIIANLGSIFLITMRRKTSLRKLIYLDVSGVTRKDIKLINASIILAG